MLRFLDFCQQTVDFFVCASPNSGRGANGLGAAASRLVGFDRFDMDARSLGEALVAFEDDHAVLYFAVVDHVFIIPNEIQHVEASGKH